MLLQSITLVTHLGMNFLYRILKLCSSYVCFESFRNCPDLLKLWQLLSNIKILKLCDFWWNQGFSYPTPGQAWHLIKHTLQLQHGSSISRDSSSLKVARAIPRSSAAWYSGYNLTGVQHPPIRYSKVGDTVVSWGLPYNLIRCSTHLPSYLLAVVPAGLPPHCPHLFRFSSISCSCTRSTGTLISKVIFW